MRLILDHSIVGQSATTLTIRKDREFAGCCICGIVFQSVLCTHTTDHDWNTNPEIQLAAAIETREWRNRHNKTHSDSEHRALRESGRTFTPEAAIRLAPFGLVPVADVDDPEIAQALLEAPRAPVDDVESSLKGYVPFK